MNENENLGVPNDFNQVDYDETIGVFSNTFYKNFEAQNKEPKVTETVVETEKIAPADTIDKENKIAEGSNETETIIEQEISKEKDIKENIAETKIEAKAEEIVDAGVIIESCQGVEAVDNDGTVNAFIINNSNNNAVNSVAHENTQKAEENVEKKVKAEVSDETFESLPEVIENEGTVNAFAINNKAAATKVMSNTNTPKMEEKKPEAFPKKEPVVQRPVNPPINNARNINNNVNVGGISFAFFNNERKRLEQKNLSEIKKYKILCIVCAVLCLTIIPLFLLPIFIIKYIGVSKGVKINTYMNYNTLKWNAFKQATKYEVYIRIDDTDRFRLYSVQNQPKCSFSRGRYTCVIVAKSNVATIAVSDAVLVTV